MYVHEYLCLMLPRQNWLELNSTVLVLLKGTAECCAAGLMLMHALQGMAPMLMVYGCGPKPRVVCNLALSSSLAPVPGATQ